jgi:radical SAM superfamily enzyme YgiQ (UPF0313 family)
MSGKARVLLVNPWIYDFAAFNLWIEPLGLLIIAAVLRDQDYAVTVLDCLAPHAGAPVPRANASGKLLKTVVEKPAPLTFVPRCFGRYGLLLGRFDSLLDAVPTPDCVMVASGMTYWYPGVAEAIRRVRSHFGSVPVALGGVYATLCPEHARQHSLTDRVIPGPGVVEALRFADEVTGRHSDFERYADPRTWPAPAHELVPRPYAGIITSWGCPCRCTYCASHRLQASHVRREPSAVVAEIGECAQRGIREFAFYDDALLVDADHHVVPILEGVVRQGLRVRFHTPNGLHARELTAELATLMHRAGFGTVRLSLETVDPGRQQATGAKVNTEDWMRAVIHLQAAGFGAQELGVYVLAGLPDQPLAETEETVRFVLRQGVQAKLALFSPIPGTPDGDRALPTDADPLLHNDTVFPYLRGSEYVRELQRIKQLVQKGNSALVNGA